MEHVLVDVLEDVLVVEVVEVVVEAVLVDVLESAKVAALACVTLVHLLAVAHVSLTVKNTVLTAVLQHVRRIVSGSVLQIAMVRATLGA